MPRTRPPLVRFRRIAIPPLLFGVVVVFFGLALWPGPAAAADAESSEAAELRLHGISPDAAGVRAYLDNLFPSSELGRRVDQLIAELGNGDFATRQAASRALSGIGAARPALTEALNNPDAEISHRAGRILDASADNQESLLPAALSLIGKENLRGAAPQVIRAMTLCQTQYLRRSAATALAATVRPADVPLLKRAIATGDLQVRTAAIVALEKAAGPAADESLRPLLKSDDDATRLSAVEALVNRMPRECLGVLISLLESDQAAIRMRSGRYLRQLTGEHFDIAGGKEDAAARQQMAAQWQAWAAGPGRSATLHVPLPAAPASLGRTLICLSSGKGKALHGLALPALVEIDDQGHVTTVLDPASRPRMPFGCQGLSNGHRMYVDGATSTVAEADESGKIVWQMQVPGRPNSVERLENGNTLVALYTAKQVIELSPGGSVVRRLAVGGAPTDAHGLENGNVLVAIIAKKGKRGQIVEFDRNGNVAWRVEGERSPWSARRLANGNTLVAYQIPGKVVEYSPQGKVTWSLQGLRHCYDAFPLENGHVLVGSDSGLREVDRNGKTIEERPIGTVRRISVY